MSLFSRSVASNVYPGDRFTKVGNPLGTVWEVYDLIVPVDGIPHVRLRNDGGKGAMITIAASVILDSGFWTPA